MTYVVFTCVFFFVKQKTAYCMRISDWSSDVCSSDLQGVELVGHGYVRAGERAWQLAAGTARHVLLVQRQRHIFWLAVVERVVVTGNALHFRKLDRKSVVSGKSVSVRVDLGGRRLYTKKN